jgi:hypothetical protein
LADLRARYLAGWSAFGDEASRATALDLALRVGCLHHAISYQHIVMAVEPAARWEYMSGARFFLRALLAALAPPLPDPPAATGGRNASPWGML